MSVYTKLNEARSNFHKLQLKKTGLNKFAGYSYFELSDFLIPALGVFKDAGLCAFISFGKEVATMTIVDIEDGSKIELTSPMAEAQLKGCHPIQNLGAVETYTRRYLWVSALEIVEHDAIDSSKGVEKEIKHSPTGEPAIEPSRMAIVADVAESVMIAFDKTDIIGAYEEYTGITDNEERVALWKLLPSNVRSAIKKHGESLKSTT